MLHGGALQKLLLAKIEVCCVRQLEKTKIAYRNDKNLLCALGFSVEVTMRYVIAEEVSKAEKFWYSRKSHYAYLKNNEFRVEFQRVYDLTISIVINYPKLIY